MCSFINYNLTICIIAKQAKVVIMLSLFLANTLGFDSIVPYLNCIEFAKILKCVP